MPPGCTLRAGLEGHVESGGPWWPITSSRFGHAPEAGISARSSGGEDLEKMDSSGEVLNQQRIQDLEAWLQSTNIKLMQVNGQRRYGGPPEDWKGPAPGARCEVFISRLPRDAYEDLLIPLFSSVGPLYEFRLMMNFSGQNRGFAYAKYSSPATAWDAIRLLHGHTLEPGCRLSVRLSTEKRHLSLGQLPRSTRQRDLLQVLCTLADGVQSVVLKSGAGVEGVSAVVGFSSHYAASMAKKMLVEAFMRTFSLPISIKWQSAVRPSEDPLGPLHRPPLSEDLLRPLHRPPPCPAQLPRLIHTPKTSAPPPGLAPPPCHPLEFCRVVGGPSAQYHHWMPLKR